MLQAYLAELRKTKLLSSQEEAALWQASLEGDTTAHSRLMAAYQPLVFKLAMEFKLPEPESMELIQEGMIGLLEAAEKFDYRRGVAFSLFASYRIKGAMLNYLAKSKESRLRYLESEYNDGFSLGDKLASEVATPAEVLEKHLLQEKVKQAFMRLPRREQQVLRGIFFDDQPAQVVAARINISLTHVYRLQKQGVRRIRGMLSRFMHELKE